MFYQKGINPLQIAEIMKRYELNENAKMIMQRALDNGEFDNYIPREGMMETFLMGADLIIKLFIGIDYECKYLDKRENENDTQYIERLKDRIATAEMSNRGWLSTIENYLSKESDKNAIPL